MARLNPESPQKTPGLRRGIKLGARKKLDLDTNALGEVRDSPPPSPAPRKKLNGIGTIFDSPRSKSGISRPFLGKNRTQKIGTGGFGGGGDFDIFSDSDFMSEREGEEYDSSTGPTRDAKTKKRIPLKLAHVNSLLLPIPTPQQTQTQSRNRPRRKPELDDYDKENDPVEHREEDSDDRGSGLSRNSSNASTRQSPVRRNAQQTPGRTKGDNGRQFLDYRQPEKQKDDENSDEDNNDNSFDSMDNFIVGDNEELSSHEASANETEDEQVQETPPPPPKTRRKLVRGKRPNPEAELKKILENPLQKQELRLEPSLPAAFAMPSPAKPEPKPKQAIQDDFSIAEEMNDLAIENSDPAIDNDVDQDEFDPSSQLANELSNALAHQYSPGYKSESEVEVLATPPSSLSKNRLQSPTKEKARVPPTPYRESVDAFWSQEATDAWVDQHSPRKNLQSLMQEFEESDNDSSPQPDIMSRARRENKKEKPPSKAALKRAEIEHKKAVQALKKSFDDRKAAFAEEFFRVLDDAVSGGQIQKQAEEVGGVKIIWSKTLQTTAGRATWKRERVRTSGNGTETVTSSKHHASIELAERIIDSEDRLLNTLAHEYCHLANYMISNVHNNPHGVSFKQWGRKCKDALKDHPVYGGRVEVTTKHSYKIDYKYVWCCVDCGQDFGRHSKSIDTTRSRCGRCKGLLQQIKPKPRNVSPRKKQPAQQSETTFEKRAVDDVVRVLGEVSLDS